MEAQTSSEQLSPQEQRLFEQVETYPWETDQEFQMGLRSILGGQAPTPQTYDIGLRARCFFFARKNGQQVDFQKYKDWHYTRAASMAAQGRTTSAPQADDQTQGIVPVDGQTSNVNGSSDQDSASLADILARASQNAAVSNGPDDGGAKLSYAEIVEMIQSGKEIPGIKQIPSTILQGQGSSASQSRRKKPWEKDEGADSPAEVA